MTTGFAAAGQDFAKRVQKLATAVREGERETLLRAGLAGKEPHIAAIRRDSGDMRLSGVGRKGARVNARFDVRGNDRVEFKATGPLHFLANPMSPHTIGPKRRSDAKVLKIPGIGHRRSVQHPGTRGKDTWNKATADARKAVSREIHERQVNIVRKALG